MQYKVKTADDAQHGRTKLFESWWVTPKQYTLLQVITAYWSQHDRAPSMRELSEVLNVSKQAVADMTKTLLQRGLITRRKDAMRSVKTITQHLYEIMNLALCGPTGVVTLWLKELSDPQRRYPNHIDKFEQHFRGCAAIFGKLTIWRVIQEVANEQICNLEKEL